MLSRRVVAYVNNHYTLFANAHSVQHLAMIRQIFDSIINDDLSWASKLSELRDSTRSANMNEVSRGKIGLPVQDE